MSALYMKLLSVLQDLIACVCICESVVNIAYHFVTIFVLCSNDCVLRYVMTSCDVFTVQRAFDCLFCTFLIIF